MLYKQQSPRLPAKKDNGLRVLGVAQQCGMLESMGAPQVQVFYGTYIPKYFYIIHISLPCPPKFFVLSCPNVSIGHPYQPKEKKS